MVCDPNSGKKQSTQFWKFGGTTG